MKWNSYYKVNIEEKIEKSKTKHKQTVKVLERFSTKLKIIIKIMQQIIKSSF